MAILNKRISSATLPQLQKDARLGSIIRDVDSAPATENAMYRTINPSVSTNQTPSPAYVSQLTSALREMQNSPQNVTSRIAAPTRSNDVSLMSSQMPDMSSVPNISKGPITSITSPGDTARQKIGSTTSTSGGIPSAVVNALAGAVMGLGAQKILTGGNKSGSQSGSQSGNKAGSQNPPVTSTTDKLPTWAQGNPTIKSNGDGTYTQKNDDGSTTTLDKDGNIIGTTDSNGDIVDKNGSTVHDNGDGTHTITARDGTVTVRNDDGTDVTGHQAGPEVLPPVVDDYTQYSNVGNPHSEYGDELKRGGLAVMMKNGGVPHYAGGGVTQDNGNGTFTTKNADGSTVTKDDQGNIIRQTDASGNILSGDTSSNPIQSILDLIGTSGGAAGAGGLLAALLSSTGGNTNNVNTGLDMSTYGLLNPRTTTFGMGPARFVPHSDYSQRGSYTPNAELLHNLNAPASNPVNEGDYIPNYVTNRPGTTNNMSGGTDINALIAQIVNAMQNRQLAQNVQQASNTTGGTTGGGSAVATSVGGTQPPKVTMVGGGVDNYKMPGGTTAEGYSKNITPEQRYALNDFWIKNQGDASKVADYLKSNGLTLNDLSLSRGVDLPGLTNYFESHGVSATDPLLKQGTATAEQKQFLAWQGEQINPVTGKKMKDEWAARGITDPTQDPSLLTEATHQITTASGREALGVPVSQTRQWASTPVPTGGQTTSTPQTAADWANTPEGQKAGGLPGVYNSIRTYLGTNPSASDLQNMMQMYGVTPEILQAAKDYNPNVVVGPTTNSPSVESPTNPSRSRALSADASADYAPLVGGLNAVTKASSPLGQTDGIPLQEVDPNSGYQNPGSSIAQMQNDLYPSKQPISNGGEYVTPIGDLGPQDFMVDPDRSGPVTPSAPTPTEPMPYVRSGPTPEEIQAMIDAQNSYSSSGGAKKGGAIHKATGGLTHYTYGKPADVMENLGLRGQQMAQGGLPHVSNVPIVQGRMDFRQGSAVHGEGDGQSDDIPAMLADGEYVIDAETVAQIGNGSTKAGAQALDKFRESIRAHKRSAPINKIPPKTKALTSYLKVK